MANERAMVISRHWAAVFTGLIVAGIIGGLTFAQSSSAAIAVLQSDVKDLKEAKLEVRLGRMEEKLDYLVKQQKTKP